MEKFFICNIKRKNISLDLNYIVLQCRRGMLELDQILLNFVTKHYSVLSTFNQQKFSLLLQENDIDLCNWLIGSSIPENNEFKEIVLLIRSFL